MLLLIDEYYEFHLSVAKYLGKVKLMDHPEKMRVYLVEQWSGG